MSEEKADILLSIVSPVYKAERIVDELVKRIRESVGKITQNYEVILVEDGGPDKSWDKIVENCQNDVRIKGIKLSRNFGQHHAITAGLDYCSGQWIVVMDCDLQDQPEEIEKLYNKALEGYDVVYARRAGRKDGFIKKRMSRLFRGIFGWLAGLEIDKSISNYGIYSKTVIDNVVKLREPMRNFVLNVNWLGFKYTIIDVAHSRRFEGKSSYNFSKLFSLALTTILAHSDKPLRLTVNLGLLISFTAFLFSCYNLYLYIIGRITQPGYITLILSIWILGGLIIFLLGVVGLYIGKIFEAVKDRPLYVVERIMN